MNICSVTSLLLFVVCIGVKAEELTEAKFVELVLKRNPKLREVYYQILAQREQEKAIYSMNFPSIEFEYSYSYLKDQPYTVLSYSPTPLFPGIKVDKIETKIPVGSNQNVKYSITLKLPMFTGFYLTNLKKLEEKNVQIKELSHELLTIELSHIARISYYNTLFAKRQLEVAEESVKQLEAHLEEARRYFEAGLIPYNDLLKVEVQLLKMKEQREQSKKYLIDATTSLNILIQEDPLKEVKLAEIKDVEIIPEIDVKKLIELAKNKRPEIKIMKILTEQAKLAIELSKSAYYPTVTGFTRYQKEGDDIIAKDSHYTNNENLVFGITVNMNIFDSGKREHTINQKEYEYLSIKEKAKQIEDNIVKEVIDAYGKVKTALKNIETARKALEKAEEDFRITKLQYKANLAKAIEVIDSEKALTEAKMLYYTSLYSYYIAISELTKACGLTDKHVFWEFKNEK